MVERSMVFRKIENNKWSEPVNMGPTINSSYDEISPFFQPDGVTLFYSSNNEKSIGGYDIFVLKKIKIIMASC